MAALQCRPMFEVDTSKYFARDSAGAEGTADEALATPDGASKCARLCAVFKAGNIHVQNCMHCRHVLHR